MNPRWLLVLVMSTAALPLLAPAADPSKEQDVAEIEKKFGPPVLWVPKPKASPVIDGKLDDAAWAAARPVTLGFSVGGWDVPKQKTEAWVLADEQAIYFAVRCFEAHPEQMRSAGDQRDGNLFTGDTVEFFLDPGHKEKRSEYYHVAVNPKGVIYDARGTDPKAWDAAIVAKTETFAGGWTVEAAVPMKDLGVAGQIPKVWGLNINRNRPELGVALPKAAVGAARFVPQVRPLDEPAKYREGELTGWSPTYADFNYPEDSRPFHVPQRFGHALLEVGTREVAPPDKLFEVLVKADFDDGKIGPFKNGVIHDENFRGPGKCLAGPKEGNRALYLTQPLADLEDVTLIMAFRMPSDGRMYYYGRSPDNAQCGADRHEIFLTEEVAKARAANPRLSPTFDLYDTHADKMAWKPWGRLWKGPGPWAMATGYFSEPSAGSVMYAGKEWVILRTRVGLFRRYPGSRPGQNLVPATQNYPQGLLFFPDTGQLLIDEFVIFRGADVEPPERVRGVTVRREEEELAVSWERAKDNTLTAYYRLYAGKNLLAETHQLSARVKAASTGSAPLTVVAYDLYGNASEPSAPAQAGK